MAARVHLAILAVVVLSAAPSRADDPDTYQLVLKDHAFSPAELHVPSGKPFFVVVKNASGEPDEFEMLIPSVERAVPDGGEARVHIRPLAPGRWPFFGEGDPDNEKGAFVAE